MSICRGKPLALHFHVLHGCCLKILHDLDVSDLELGRPLKASSLLCPRSLSAPFVYSVKIYSFPLSRRVVQSRLYRLLSPPPLSLEPVVKVVEIIVCHLFLLNVVVLVYRPVT